MINGGFVDIVIPQKVISSFLVVNQERNAKVADVFLNVLPSVLLSLIEGYYSPRMEILSSLNTQNFQKEIFIDDQLFREEDDIYRLRTSLLLPNNCDLEATFVLKHETFIKADVPDRKRMCLLVAFTAELTRENLLVAYKAFYRLVKIKELLIPLFQPFDYKCIKFLKEWQMMEFNLWPNWVGGSIKHSDGNTYQGDWKDNEYEGRGSFLSNNGDKYDGFWTRGKRSGLGKMIYSNGNIYVGHWRNNMCEGKGSLQWSDGGTYKGDWFEGERSGKGIMTYPLGDPCKTYDGEWQKDRRHGHGTLAYSDGSNYKGVWCEDRRHGHGTLIYSDGSSYEGVWCEDRRHGIGTFTYSGGNSFRGEWYNDEFSWSRTFPWSRTTLSHVSNAYRVPSFLLSSSPI